MPPANSFRHQQYTNQHPVAPYRLIDPESMPEAGTDEFLKRMLAVGDVYRSAGVAAVYLVHGTFVGHDAGGLWAELSRLLPAAGDFFRQLNKKWIDAVVGEQGNYTERYAQLFEQSINHNDRRRIPVRLFHWSSENHHIGRAAAAVRLLDELDGLKQPARVMLWGHSHAGNVFALMTNLLGGDIATIDAFFDAVRICHRSAGSRRNDLPNWQQMRQRLNGDCRPLAETNYDFVTFGTPIRYGWDTGGYSGLLHFVNHRPAEGVPEYLTRFPPPVENVLQAVDGDYIQQMGIAGTNVLPSVLAWRSLWADRKLNKFLQPNLRVQDLPERMKLGMRVPADGTTLLVNYGRPADNIARHHAGHAVYTLPDWLLFHAERSAACLYEGGSSAGGG